VALRLAALARALPLPALAEFEGEEVVDDPDEPAAVDLDPLLGDARVAVA
jgi:hypothetical protein